MTVNPKKLQQHLFNAELNYKIQDIQHNLNEMRVMIKELELNPTQYVKGDFDALDELVEKVEMLKNELAIIVPVETDIWKNQRDYNIVSSNSGAPTLSLKFDLKNISTY